ncbi:interferon lambda receptor 1 [Syngnathus scovelli]|uniref:interferon lambda receptor 1 n=1 Tax=Syngnathus scovelli TaxID=161590 RepID=UPI00210F8E60|nr:interleukin-22 receptor subunit alpha-2 [Syngnathus scovelli]
MCSVKVIILLFCYACLSTGATRVSFESKNFYNVLNWIAAEPSSTDQKVLYSVQYRRYDSEHRFQIKTECQNITALHCDLTMETPSLPDVHYVARVFANGRFHGRTTRFNPVAHMPRFRWGQMMFPWRTSSGRARGVPSIRPLNIPLRSPPQSRMNRITAACLLSLCSN